MAGLFSDMDFTKDYSKDTNVNKITLDEDELLDRLNPFGITMDSSDNIKRMERLYFKKGMRRLEHYIKPRVLDSNYWYFPLDSEVHLHKVSTVVEDFTKDYCFFKNNPRTIVDTIINYTEDCNSGKFRAITTPTLMAIIQECLKKEKEFTFLKPGQKIKLNSRMLMAYNYNYLAARHIYPEQPLRRLHMYNNTTTTILQNLFKVPNRYTFLILDLPDTLPTRIQLDKFCNRLNPMYLEQLPTYKHLNLLELWKFIKPEYRDKSLFSLIPKDKINSVNLLLVIDTKLVLLNLGFLLAGVKEYNMGDMYKIKPKTAEQFKILFYRFLETFIETPGMTDAQVDTLEDVLDNNKTEANATDEFVDKYGRKVTFKELIDVDATIEKDIKEVEKEKEQEEKEEEVEVVDNIDIDSEDIQETDSVEEEIDVEDVKLEKPASVEAIVNSKPKYDKVTNNIEDYKDLKIISKPIYNRLNKVLAEQQTKADPYGSTSTVAEILEMDVNKENTLPESKAKITDNKVIFDKSYNMDTIKVKEQEYIKNQYKKDIVRTFYSLQNTSMVVEDYSISTKDSIVGSTEEHTVKVNSITGSSSTIKVVLPTIKEDGTFTLNSQTYSLRGQKADAPIRKLSNTRVGLTSAYGKMFVDKASYKKEDAGYYIMVQIANMYKNNLGIKNLILTPEELFDVELPLLYRHFARYIKSFEFNKYKFTFDYRNRYNLYPNMDKSVLTKLETDNLILIGKLENKPILMDSKSRIFVYDKGFKELEHLLDILGIDRYKEPIEFASIKIYKKQVPVVLLLSYYYSLANLLDILKVNYTKHEANKRVSKELDTIVIKFKDATLEIERDHGIIDILFGGFTIIKDVLKTVNIDVLNNRSSYSVLFSKLDYTILYTNEIKLLEDMYVDPVTLSILEMLKEPTNFKGLLIKAAEMLVDDNYRNPNGADGICIKGYDRIASMLYKELVTSIKEKENKGVFSKTKLTVNPYAIITKLQEDSTTTLVDDLNPMASLKQKEDITALGAGGRSKEGMSKDTRALDSSEIGILSEAAKDNGDVGISGYLTANPKINDLRGTVAADEKMEKLEWANLLSTSALLSPFGTTDDMKRLNFSSIMNSHVVPINNMRVPYVRTGYEAIIPIRASDKFATVAKNNGKVVNVTKNTVVVRYEGEDKDTVYKYSNWTSKEESEACYTHVMVPNVAVGDTFGKDDTLIYDSVFFEPDIFNPKRVIYKQGTVVTVAMLEDLNTHEDSATLSKSMSSKLGTVVTKVKSLIMECKDNISNIKMPGEDIGPEDVLFSITDGIIQDGLDAKTLEILQSLKTKSPKAKVRGNIHKIEVRYTVPLEEMSPSMANFVKEIDKEMVKMYGYTGYLNSTYTIGGRLLQQGQIEIKYYIHVDNGMGIGDKIILGNQMKCTVGEVFNDNIHAEDGTPIDITFSARSVSNRIVNSPWLMGTTGRLLEAVKDKAVAMYFNS